jgi:hypothetical protein
MYMQWSRKGATFVWIMGILLVLASCGQAASATESATALQITRSSAVPNNHYPGFTTTISDPAKASQLYDAILQLPTQKATFCPLDNGLQYNLVFTRPAMPQTHILLSASGCRSAVLATNDRRATNDDFWSLVAQTVGITKDALFIKPA